jgi:MHS family proline/betaine transporter-like MFS transporter
MAPAFYVMAAALVGIIALRSVQETSGRALAD